MKNKEKYLDAILTSYLYRKCDDIELEMYGVKKDEDGKITHAQILDWWKSEYKEPGQEVDDSCIGTMIEVSFDGEKWEWRRYLGKFNEWYICSNDVSGAPFAWKFARRIKEK